MISSLSLAEFNLEIKIQRAITIPHVSAMPRVPYKCAEKPSDASNQNRLVEYQFCLILDCFSITAFDFLECPIILSELHVFVGLGLDTEKLGIQGLLV